MRINEVLNSKNYIVEAERKPQVASKIMKDFLQNAARVGSTSAKDPEVIAKSIAIFVSQPDLSPDEAFSIAKGQISKKNDRGDKPKRDFAINTRDGDNALRPGSEVRKDQQQADRKRGAQLGNQNARKNFGSDILKGLNRVKDVMTKGTLGDIGTAASVGSDVAKDAFSGLDNIAQTKDPKSMGRVFGD